MVDYEYLSECPIYSEADIFARTGMSSDGPSVMIKGMTKSLDGEQNLSEVLPHLKNFLNSSHPATFLASWHRHPKWFRVWFSRIDQSHLEPICNMLLSCTLPFPLFIGLANNNLTDEGISYISKVFKLFPTNVIIGLWDTHFGDLGVQHIRDALLQSPIPCGFRLSLGEKASAVQQALLDAINMTLENVVPDLESIIQAINGYNALHGLWPDQEWDTVNAKELLCQRYFMHKLSTIILNCKNAATNLSQIEAELHGLLVTFSDKTSEFCCPKSYLWTSLLNGFVTACDSLPSKPTNFAIVEKKLRLSQSAEKNERVALDAPRKEVNKGLHLIV